MVKSMVPRLFSLLYPMAMNDESLREFLGAEGVEDLHRYIYDIALKLELPLSQRQPMYSQEGEDLFVARLFDGQKRGFYVDVGAHHPFRFSNTYLLYLNGWRGINIDAMPGSMAAFRKLRPRDINVECLISRDPQPMRFFQYDEPALNTVDEEVVKKRQVESPQYRVNNVITLEARSLSAVLAEHLPPGQVIDLMNIDVEGHDMDVLESHDWQRFRPRVLIVELISTSFDDMQNTPVYKFLAARGYRLQAKLFNSAIFL
jgi:FkbM family methyltransferase